MPAMDATRVRDNLQVMLKSVFPAEGPDGLRVSRLFSSPELATMPDNHCAPLLDVIEFQRPERPEPQKLMVFPLSISPSSKHLENSSLSSPIFVKYDQMLHTSRCYSVNGSIGHSIYA